MTDVAIKALISRGVADALAEHEIQINNNLNGDVSQGSGSGITRPVRPTRECTYTDFLKCQPMNLKGIEGVVGLTQWFEEWRLSSISVTVQSRTKAYAAGPSKSMVDLCQNVPSASTIIMVRVHRSSTSTTRLATWPVIVLAMLTLVTIREPLGLIRG
ncbi:hypothetical protein Tco_0055418, partial [Tanacetum coccineum]